MGIKGSGKTKKLIDLVTTAANEEHGNIVCIEKDQALMYSIPYSIRLISASHYNFGSYDFMKGFISGLHAGNYDITHIFIDNLMKLINDQDISHAEEFISWCDEFSKRESVNFTMTLSADTNLATPGISKFFC